MPHKYNLIGLRAFFCDDGQQFHSATIPLHFHHAYGIYTKESVDAEESRHAVKKKWLVGSQINTHK